MPFFDRQTETMPREELRHVQVHKLAAMLEGIVGRNRFYSEKMHHAGVTPEDIRSLEDLARLPLTTKDELIEAAVAFPPFGSNLTFREGAYTRIHQTSGTTGRPLKVV
ncbi:MAG TPA: phenylacetate--CoA ligase family protein, partial [Acidimicrobiia bacterium]|nr:phenylacetate--CoA ligase family protein [Acidimicrobiia bacterium]